MGMADVTLVLQNSEEEMQINHRVFRSGESEYRLDGKTVRLRDIQDELWKKAISENKYFVIEQGAIGTFVTSKPTEKRALIEEAAGHGLLQGQEAPGREQARRLRAEPHPARGHHRRGRQGPQLPGPPGRRRRAVPGPEGRGPGAHGPAFPPPGASSSSPASATSRPSTKRAWPPSTSPPTGWPKPRRASRRSAAEAWDLEQSLKDGRENLFSLRSQIARAESEREREIRRTEFFEEKRRKAAADTDELLAELLQIERGLVQAEEDLETGRASWAKAEAEAGDLERAQAEAEAAVEPWVRRVAELRAELVRKFADLTEARNEGARLEKEIELIRRQEEKARDRKAGTESRIGEKEREAEDLGGRESRLRADIAGQGRGPRPDGARPWPGRGPPSTTAQAGLASLTEKRDEDAYHLQALRKFEEKERASEPLFDVEGALGPFTDLLESDPDDAPLVDVFWKEETRATLIEAAELLRNLDAREVRGQFLLLPERTKDRPAPPEINHPDVIGMLRGRLRPNPRLAGRLPELEDALIVRDIRTAIRLWLDHPALSFVSLTGDVLTSGGLLKLGQREEGLFTLAQEIKELERKLARHEDGIRPAAAALEELKLRRRGLEETIGSESLGLGELRRSLVEAEKSLALVQADRANLADDLALVGHELEVLAMDRTGFDRRAEEHARGLALLEEEERALRTRLETEERELELHQERANREAKRLVELRGTIGIWAEKTANAEALIAALGRRKEGVAAKTSALQDEARLAEEEKGRTAELIEELGRRAGALEAQIGTQESALAGGESRLEEVRKSLDAAEADLTGSADGPRRPQGRPDGLGDPQGRDRPRPGQPRGDLLAGAQENPPGSEGRARSPNPRRRAISRPSSKRRRTSSSGTGRSTSWPRRSTGEQKERHEFLVQQRKRPDATPSPRPRKRSSRSTRRAGPGS